MIVPAFPTAPRWYRPLLQCETAALDKLYGHVRRTDAPPSASEGGVNNLRRNRLGNLIAERTIPGDCLGWDMGQHVARYAWAMGRCGGQRVVELGCGTGYGTNLLSWVSSEARGIDISERAVEEARSQYPHIPFDVADVTAARALPDADLAVCFEVLEHVDDPFGLLTGAAAHYDRLLLSFPNPLVGGSHLNPHHRVDWPLSTLKARVRAAGYRHLRAYHQTLRSAGVRAGAFPWSAVWLLDARR